jgi:hypothetical protein
VKRTATRAFDASNVFNVNQLIVDGDTFFSVVPAGGDTLILTFSAECEIQDGTSENYVMVEVQRNGIPMAPGPRVLCSGGAGPATHSATFCERVDPGTHYLSLYARVSHPGGPLVNLGPWTYQLLISE